MLWHYTGCFCGFSSEKGEELLYYGRMVCIIYMKNNAI